MLRLSQSTKAWNSSRFKSVFIEEVTALGLEQLPLQQGLSSSSVALDRNLKIMVLNLHEDQQIATIKVGAFYTGIISGCNCADDPSPTDEVNEYCEMEVRINLKDGQSSITLTT
ncbi:MAG: hypothetical protein HON68_07690 [Gammaproteobacteria bacterium]|nr:hypothetical protein [Gammaproteobacteria bacterium]MBT3488539.1 hypothetical protein [Gammaproteobacteria bacterium]MBT3719643.1 hypothetical protein [Gammaproteobacteria bacterium]MBT3843730.1 hypothetical protein [Gammaproteobacteria bacterium]MBT3892286.1 hypothetical protein [Gammaproteobacteria bacterium]